MSLFAVAVLLADKSDPAGFFGSIALVIFIVVVLLVILGLANAHNQSSSTNTDYESDGNATYDQERDKYR